MRIAYLTEMWQPSINGIVTRLTATIDELIAAGHEVLVIAPRTGPADATVPERRHLNVIRVPAIAFPFLYGGQPWGMPVPTVRTALRRFGPDLVHVVNPVWLGIAGVWAARSLGRPLVASFHTDVASYARFYHLGWLTSITWKVIAALHRRAQLNLVTSMHSARLLASHGVFNTRLWRRGVGSEFLDVGETVDGTSHDETTRSLVRRPDGTVEATRPPVALYVGRLADEKGLAKLLPLARSGRARLVLVGDGPDRERLQREFADTDTVFCGALTGQDLLDAYRSADVFVFPSTTETLGLVLLEALASGLPVVASTSPASTELLASCDAARLVPDDEAEGFTEAVDALLSSAPVEVLRAAARAEARGWDWKTATTELLAMYDAVLSVPPGTPLALSGLNPANS